jgi:hypothetical protein
MEAVVTRVMPWMRALPDRVALASFSTELGEVNICLNACERKLVGQVSDYRNTHPNKDLVSEKPIPRVIRIVCQI